jgi:uncharacterized protein YbjT (DUF2867 family)
MKMTTESQKPILLIGGNGKTGARVAARLWEAGHRVRIGSRSGEPAFSWDEPTGWAEVLDGVRAAYITYYPDLSVPGAAEAVGEFARLAVSMGVTRLVLLSGRGEPEAQHAEETLKASGADWTIVRAAWFSQNFSENFLVEGVNAGIVALPVGAVREPFIDADDIADVVFAALTNSSHVGQLYEVTGPELLTFAEAVETISKALDRPVRYVELTHEEFASHMAGEQLPADIVWLLNELFTVVLDGRNEYLSNGVQRALGRAPRSFEHYAANAVGSGAWNRLQLEEQV